MREKINQTACDILGDTQANLMDRKAFEDSVWLDKEKYSFVIKSLKTQNLIIQIKSYKGIDLTINAIYLN